MSNTSSNMLPLGTTAPEFNLIETVTKKMMSLNEVKGVAATLVMFNCNHSPFFI